MDADEKLNRRTILWIMVSDVSELARKAEAEGNGASYLECQRQLEVLNNRLRELGADL